MQLAVLKETARGNTYACFVKNERPRTDDAVAANLRRLMAIKGWSQSELSRRTGVSQTHIGGILRGESGCTVPMAEQLAKPFGIPGWQLVMPNLPDELMASGALRALVESYINASTEGRGFVDAAVKLGRGKTTEDVAKEKPVGIATSRARNRPESDDETDLKSSKRA